MNPGRQTFVVEIQSYLVYMSDCVLPLRPWPALWRDDVGCSPRLRADPAKTRRCSVTRRMSGDTSESFAARKALIASPEAARRVGLSSTCVCMAE